MFRQFKRLTWKASLIATVVSTLAFTVALAASGDLDTTFDGDGLVTSFASPANPGRFDIAWDVAIQTDGKILAAGYSYIPSTATRDFAVTRYNTEGTLDATFSGDGRLLTNLGGQDYGYDVALQANGKPIVAGTVCFAASTVGPCDVAVARYNAGGTLDITFSTDGKQTSDFGGGDNGSFGGLAVQSNGKIVAAGGAGGDFALVRYNSNGTLDTTFSTDGRVRVDFGAGDAGLKFVVQSDGRYVLAGSTQGDFALARVLP